VVHVHNVYPSLGPAVHLAARSARVPLVMTVHNARLRCPNGLMFTQGSPCRRCEAGAYFRALSNDCFATRRQAQAYAVNLWLHRFILRLEEQVARFIAPSCFVRQRLLDWGFQVDRIQVVRNFTPLRPDASATVGTHGLYVGRLAEEKGLRDLLIALRRAGDPPFQIVGDGPLAQPLRALAGELELRRTQFLGWLDRADVARVIRAARYLVMPSRCDENAPLAVLEAMAEGRPLLLSRSGGLPELAADGAGMLFERGDHQDLATKLRELEKDELCLQAGTAALRFARRELAPEAHLRGLEEAYAAVVEQAAARLGLGSVRP
jgi:glycosyltransferase involved in cell wall biosynthesis